MTFTYTWSTPEQVTLKREDQDCNVIFIPAVNDNPLYEEFLESGVTPAAYVAPPPVVLTTEQKIAAAGFDEGELEEFLVAKIQARLNE